MRRRSLGLSLLLLAWLGCSPEWEMRKDPDLWHFDPKQTNRLHDVRIDPDYTPRVTAKSEWQNHTSLSNRPFLTDGDPTTVAASSDEHRQGEFILIDLGHVCHFQNVHQLHPADGGSPPGYRVDTADERGFPFTLQFVGSGQPGKSTATFPRAVGARFVRITIVEDSAKPWAVAEIDVD